MLLFHNILSQWYFVLFLTSPCQASLPCVLFGLIWIFMFFFFFNSCLFNWQLKNCDNLSASPLQEILFFFLDWHWNHEGCSQKWDFLLGKLSQECVSIYSWLRYLYTSAVPIKISVQFHGLNCIVTYQGFNSHSRQQNLTVTLQLTGSLLCRVAACSVEDRSSIPAGLYSFFSLPHFG